VTGATFSKVLVLNGPNLGRLGTRQTDVYGLTSYAELAEMCIRVGKELGLAVEVRQTDAEAEMLGWLYAAADERSPVVMNPGAWAHYSYALRDACALLTAPLIEVHISNVHARESYRHHSWLSPVAAGIVVGFGIDGYVLAIEGLLRKVRPGTGS